MSVTSMKLQEFKSWSKNSAFLNISVSLIGFKTKKQVTLIPTIKEITEDTIQ